MICGAEFIWRYDCFCWLNFARHWETSNSDWLVNMEPSSSCLMWAIWQIRNRQRSPARSQKSSLNFSYSECLCYLCALIWCSHSPPCLQFSYFCENSCNPTCFGQTVPRYAVQCRCLSYRRLERR